MQMCKMKNIRRGNCAKRPSEKRSLATNLQGFQHKGNKPF